MISYRLSKQHAHRQFIQFQASFPSEKDTLKLQLPAWRPGRYELGNFAQYIRDWGVYNKQGQALTYRKITKDLWEVFCPEDEEVILRYQFSAHLLNAGSTWLDEEQLYVNPVNCFFYNPDDQQQEFRVELDVPNDWKIACQLRRTGNTLYAPNVQELMDAPFIASAKLKHWDYNVEGVNYHLWVMGDVHYDSQRFLREHQAFTEAMIQAFGDIPCEEYHFLYQFPAFAARHGVEHQASTVIAMGPAETLADEVQYRELMGIACHELYHVWNVKAIRPADMMPYDFSKENYSELGYVCEGVTTWFGDEFLHRTGVFDDEEFFQRVSRLVNRHVWNPGRFNLSVAESSRDTWLDGYQAGIPWRKVSIYNEGSLIAFICDARLREHSRGSKSLDDVMKLMHERFGKTGKGYTSGEYLELLQEVGETSFQDIFRDLVLGTEDYLPYIRKAVQSRGWSMESIPNDDPIAAMLGIRVLKDKIVGVWPNGPADRSGMWYGDVVLANPDELRNQIRKDEPITIDIQRHGKQRTIEVNPAEGCFMKYAIRP